MYTVRRPVTQHTAGDVRTVVCGHVTALDITLTVRHWGAKVEHAEHLLGAQTGVWR